MEALNLKTELVWWANRLRPPGKVSSSILNLAYELGTAVWLRLHTGHSAPTAQINLSTRIPKITVYRPSAVDGERQIARWEDDLLTPRERFSVAHELGHWIAYVHCQVPPEADRRKYWEQEHAINAFAGCLLAPEWLVAKWLDRIPHGEPVNPSMLRIWAASQCRCSEEVVAKALVRQRKSIGFLKVLQRPNAAGTDVLDVLSSAAGTDLDLPPASSHIRDSQLLELLRSKYRAPASISQARLGKCEPLNLCISWCDVSPYSRTMWLAIAVPSRCSTCDASLFGITALVDDKMPHCLFCSPECRTEATIGLPTENSVSSSEERFKNLES